MGSAIRYCFTRATVCGDRWSSPIISRYVRLRSAFEMTTGARISSPGGPPRAGGAAVPHEDALDGGTRPHLAAVGAHHVHQVGGDHLPAAARVERPLQEVIPQRRAPEPRRPRG